MRWFVLPFFPYAKLTADTCCAIVSTDRKILSSTIHSEPHLHEQWGGIVPHVAMSSHQRHLPNVIKETLSKANMSAVDIDAIAVTRGPGLASSLGVGMNAAKGIAAMLNKPLIGVHHMQAHALTPLLIQDLPFPHLTLLVSGGHTMLLHTRSMYDFKILANTQDDSMGDCIDKVARMLGLGWEGGSPGAALEAFIKTAPAHDTDLQISFPIPLQEWYFKGRPGFSFSGLKSSVKRYLESKAPATSVAPTAPGTPSFPAPYDISDSMRHGVATAFMEAAMAHVTQQIKLCLGQLHPNDQPQALILSGGVASNMQLRSRIQSQIGGKIQLVVPEPWLCRDNAVMIAWVGCLRLLRGDIDRFDIEHVPKWSLEDLKRRDMIDFQRVQGQELTASVA